MTNNNSFPEVIFLGQPNCGKSTLFNALAGLKAETSNFPGTTVKHTHSKVNFYGKILNIIDLPGTYSLNPLDEVENVALTHLFVEKPDLIIDVIDASLLGRSLELTLELIELEFPMVVALNMMDLAEKKGVDIDPKKLERLLGVPVIPVIATHGRGVKELIDAVFDVLDEGKRALHLDWSRDVEEKIEELSLILPEDFPVVANKRFTAVKMIEAGKLVFDDILGEINPDLKRSLRNIRDDLEKRHDAPAYEVIAAERHHLAFKLSEECSHVSRGKRQNWIDKIDDILMHPILGYFILLAVFFAFFFVIFRVGNPLEELLLNPLNHIREYLSGALGSGVIFYVLDGLIQGIGGGIAIVLPYFIPLLFMMSILILTDM